MNKDDAVQTATVEQNLYLTESKYGNFDNLVTENNAESDHSEEKCVIRTDISEDSEKDDNEFQQTSEIQKIESDSEQEIFMKKKNVPKRAFSFKKTNIVKARNKYMHELNDLFIDQNVWNKIFNFEKKSFISSSYCEVVSQKLTIQTGCQINIKGHDRGINKVVVRTYCGHSNCREFKLINIDLKNGLFKVYSNSVQKNHSSIKRRHVKGETRILMKNLLLHKFPEEVFENMVEEEDKMFLLENKTSTSKSLSVLGTIRSAALQEQDNNPDTILDLLAEIDKNDEENNWIQNLNAYPFFVQIWSKLQFDVLKYYVANCIDNEVVTYLDATGGLVTSPNGKTTLYYALIAPLKTEYDETTDSFPLTEMVSCTHNSNAISNWLRNYKQAMEKEMKRSPVINTVVMDFSFAEINGMYY